MTQSQIEALFEENPAIKNVKIRVDKKTQKASVIDVIKLVTGQNNDAASTIFKRLSNDVRTNCSKLRINGKGRETPVADAPTLVSLIWELPGKAARAFRRQSAHWVCRILGGDLRLAQEIEQRYVQTSQEAKSFFLQNAQPGPSQNVEFERRLKQRQMELDMQRKEQEFKSEMEERNIASRQRQEKMKLENEERRLVLRQRQEKIKLENEERRMVLRQRQEDFDNQTLASMKRSIEVLNMDDRDRIWFKDLVRICQKRKADQMLGRIGKAAEEKPVQFISIPLVAAQMGVRPNGKESLNGRRMVKLWREKYDKGRKEQPPKRVSLYQGREILANSYTEEDTDIMQQAIREVLLLDD